MSPDRPSHRRRSLRLQGYDYSQAGAYFVTICTQGRVCLFGEAIDDCMRLNAAGQMAANVWADIPVRFPKVTLDVFVVMPNHLHGIIVLPDDENAERERAATRAAPTDGNERNRGNAPPPRSPIDDRIALGTIVGAFKSAATVAYARGVKASRWPAFQGQLWQRGYYEHVIRNERALDRIRRYVDENPARWAFDDENPETFAS